MFPLLTCCIKYTYSSVVAKRHRQTVKTRCTSRQIHETNQPHHQESFFRKFKDNNRGSSSSRNTKSIDIWQSRIERRTRLESQHEDMVSIMVWSKQVFLLAAALVVSSVNAIFVVRFIVMVILNCCFLSFRQGLLTLCSWLFCRKLARKQKCNRSLALGQYAFAMMKKATDTL